MSTPAPTLPFDLAAAMAHLSAKDEKLAPLIVEKTMTAPVTVIVAYDLKFYEQLPRLFPAAPAIKDAYVQSAELAASPRRDRER